MTSALHREWVAEQAARAVIEDVRMRAASESTRPAVRTATGLVIGASHQPHHDAWYAQAASGPHRRPGLLARAAQAARLLLGRAA
ncbi:MAG: hypothetical protein BGO36_10710 [Burkholderiales bacterium 68-10]|nr:MAG: hypothetical protein BGO36_10710 [Burkholderiales bacterium 68-10]